MQLYFTSTSTTDSPQLLNPKGCRVIRLGSPHPLGLFITTGQAAKDQSRPRTRAVDMQEPLR
jgi:hypothetical protein